jgi:hypothetical protein
MRRLVLLALLAACPARTQQQQTAPPQPQAGAGCPAPDGVFVASYVTDAPGRGAGWVMPLHAMPVQAGAEVPDYAPLDAAAATASGVPAIPQGTLWLVTENAPPCKVTAKGYYAAKIAGPPASVSYGAELDGCPAPADPQEGGGFVMVSQDPPTGCRFEVPKPVAVRMGETDDKQQWHPPAKQTPIPPALAPLIPQHECQPPACETLWAVGEVDVNNQPVAYGAAVNWLTIGDPKDACHWKADRFSGLFVNGQKVEQEHSLALGAALVDSGGVKALFAEGPGEFAIYDPSGKLARQVTWMIAPAEAWDMVDHLGPLCPQEPPTP